MSDLAKLRRERRGAPASVRAPKICSNCEEAEATVYCLDCRKYYCGDNECFTDMHSIKKFAKHKSIPVRRRGGDKNNSKAVSDTPKSSKLELVTSLIKTIRSPRAVAAGSPSSAGVDIDSEPSTAVTVVGVGEDGSPEGGQAGPRGDLGEHRPYSEEERELATMKILTTMSQAVPELRIGERVCQLCRMSAAVYQCDKCQLKLCEQGGCDALVHAGFRLRAHVRGPVKPTPPPSPESAKTAESADEKKAAASTAIPCGVCRRATAVVFCPQCNKHLCTAMNCDKFLHLGSRKHHVRTPIVERAEGQAGEQAAPAPGTSAALLPATAPGFTLGTAPAPNPAMLGMMDRAADRMAASPAAFHLGITPPASSAGAGISGMDGEHDDIPQLSGVVAGGPVVRARLDDLQSRMRALQQQKLRLEQAVHGSTTDRAQLVAHIAAVKDEVRGMLQSQALSLQTQLEDSSHHSRALDRRLSELGEERTRLEMQLQRSGADTVEMHERLQAMHAKVENIQARTHLELQNAHRDKLALQRQFDAVRQQLRLDSDRVKAEVEGGLREELNDARAQLSHLQKQLEVLQDTRKTQEQFAEAVAQLEKGEIRVKPSQEELQARTRLADLEASHVHEITKLHRRNRVIKRKVQMRLKQQAQEIKDLRRMVESFQQQRQSQPHGAGAGAGGPAFTPSSASSAAVPMDSRGVSVPPLSLPQQDVRAHAQGFPPADAPNQPYGNIAQSDSVHGRFDSRLHAHAQPLDVSRGSMQPQELSMSTVVGHAPEDSYIVPEGALVSPDGRVVYEPPPQPLEPVRVGMDGFMVAGDQGAARMSGAGMEPNGEEGPLLVVTGAEGAAAPVTLQQQPSAEPHPHEQLHEQLHPQQHPYYSAQHQPLQYYPGQQAPSFPQPPPQQGSAEQNMRADAQPQTVAYVPMETHPQVYPYPAAGTVPHEHSYPPHDHHWRAETPMEDSVALRQSGGPHHLPPASTGQLPPASAHTQQQPSATDTAPQTVAVPHQHRPTTFPQQSQQAPSAQTQPPQSAAQSGGNSADDSWNLALETENALLRRQLEEMRAQARSAAASDVAPTARTEPPPSPPNPVTAPRQPATARPPVAPHPLREANDRLRRGIADLQLQLAGRKPTRGAAQSARDQREAPAGSHAVDRPASARSEPAETEAQLLARENQRLSQQVAALTGALAEDACVDSSVGSATGGESGSIGVQQGGRSAPQGAAHSSTALTEIPDPSRPGDGAGSNSNVPADLPRPRADDPELQELRRRNRLMRAQIRALEGERAMAGSHSAEHSETGLEPGPAAAPSSSRKGQVRPYHPAMVVRRPMMRRRDQRGQQAAPRDQSRRVIDPRPIWSPDGVSQRDAARVRMFRKDLWLPRDLAQRKARWQRGVPGGGGGPAPPHLLQARLPGGSLWGEGEDGNEFDRVFVNQDDGQSGGPRISAEAEPGDLPLQQGGGNKAPRDQLTRLPPTVQRAAGVQPQQASQRALSARRSRLQRPTSRSSAWGGAGSRSARSPAGGPVPRPDVPVSTLQAVRAQLASGVSHGFEARREKRQLLAEMAKLALGPGGVEGAGGEALPDTDQLLSQLERAAGLESRKLAAARQSQGPSTHSGAAVQRRPLRVTAAVSPAGRGADSSSDDESSSSEDSEVDSSSHRSDSDSDTLVKPAVAQQVGSQGPAGNASAAAGSNGAAIDSGSTGGVPNVPVTAGASTTSAVAGAPRSVLNPDVPVASAGTAPPGAAKTGNLPPMPPAVDPTDQSVEAKVVRARHRARHKALRVFQRLQGMGLLQTAQDRATLSALLAAGGDLSQLFPAVTAAPLQPGSVLPGHASVVPLHHNGLPMVGAPLSTQQPAASGGQEWSALLASQQQEIQRLAAQQQSLTQMLLRKQLAAGDQGHANTHSDGPGYSQGHAPLFVGPQGRVPASLPLQETPSHPHLAPESLHSTGSHHSQSHTPALHGSGRIPRTPLKGTPRITTSGSGFLLGRGKTSRTSAVSSEPATGTSTTTQPHAVPPSKPVSSQDAAASSDPPVPASTKLGQLPAHTVHGSATVDPMATRLALGSFRRGGFAVPRPDSHAVWARRKAQERKSGKDEATAGSDDAQTGAPLSFDRRLRGHEGTRGGRDGVSGPVAGAAMVQVHPASTQSAQNQLPDWPQLVSMAVGQSERIRRTLDQQPSQSGRTVAQGISQATGHVGRDSVQGSPSGFAPVRAQRGRGVQTSQDAGTDPKAAFYRSVQLRSSGAQGPVGRDPVRSFSRGHPHTQSSGPAASRPSAQPADFTKPPVHLQGAGSMPHAEYKSAFMEHKSRVEDTDADQLSTASSNHAITAGRVLTDHSQEIRSQLNPSPGPAGRNSGMGGQPHSSDVGQSAPYVPVSTVAHSPDAVNNNPYTVNNNPDTVGHSRNAFANASTEHQDTHNTHSLVHADVDSHISVHTPQQVETSDYSTMPSIVDELLNKPGSTLPTPSHARAPAATGSAGASQPVTEDESVLSLGFLVENESLERELAAYEHSLRYHGRGVDTDGAALVPRRNGMMDGGGAASGGGSHLRAPNADLAVDSVNVSLPSLPSELLNFVALED